MCSVTLCPQDTTPLVRNRTLIIDNMGHELDEDRTQMSGFDASSFRADGGRTWLSDNRTLDLDEVHMLGCTHLAISPDTGRSVRQTIASSSSHSCGYLCVEEHSTICTCAV